MVNDRPSSGQYPHTGYEGLATATFASDPLFGSLDGQQYSSQYQSQHEGYYGSSYESGQAAPSMYAGHEDFTGQQTAAPFNTAHFDSGQFATAPHDSGQYDASTWNAAPADPFPYDPYAPHASHPEPGSTGSYDATAWACETHSEQYLASIPAQLTPEHSSAQWDASAWNEAASAPADFGYDPSGHWAMPVCETGTYDATAWNPSPEEPASEHTFAEEPEQLAQQSPQVLPDHGTADFAPGEIELGEPFEDPEPAAVPLPAEAPAAETAPRPSRRAPAKSGKGGKAGKSTKNAKNVRELKGVSKEQNARRRTPARRSAVLTVAVPSACVMGVAGIAAASVGGLTDIGDDQQPSTTPMAMSAPDPASVKPVAANSKLDTQLAALRADAGDFADRASRTQERIDLRIRQEAERKKRAEEAARLEALRPKFALPVAMHGLSARYGQSGVNWMSLHTGIDFPVSYGTPVMAATDGTVRTQWNSAYGNMAIVTAPDGTETWYCHLSSTKFRSGQVKAGEVIAYSGNSGNSTGPHLHFEVRPGAGAAIDPLPWLRSHGLDPT
ncbi:peptidoglycan DD-metalloendopeptidase family protein [Streptomyces sp. NPDC006879]|uniref:peptidoglycan DD-metalloendopeptidase family protein n=1 Tax=Streptomyces sp. NPDC006879 TaxID=3364767 RepID=UPI0036805322